MPRIRISAGSFSVEAELNGSPTALAIWTSLPISAPANLWGEEIYFEIPVSMGEENAVDTVRKGDLGYWPEGECFCIFFGKTPMTTSEDEIKPASAVNPIGRIENPDALKKHRAGETVTITAAH